MRIWTKYVAVWDSQKNDYVEITEQCESYEYNGPVTLAFGGGSEPSIQQAPGSTNNTITTTKSDPWLPQQPYLLEGFQRAKGLLSQPKTYYPGATIAPVSPETNLAYRTLANQAQSDLATGGPPLVQQSASTLADLMTGNVGGTAQQIRQAGIGTFDPTLGGILSDANMQQQSQALQNAADVGIRRTLPLITSQFTNSGRSGSGLESQAIAQTAADAYAQAQAGLLRDKMGLQSAAYGQAQQILPDFLKSSMTEQARAAALAPSVAQNARQQPISNLLDVGNFQQGQAQNLINEDINRYNFNQGIQQQQLNDYLAAIQGNFGGSNQTTAPAPFFQQPGAPSQTQSTIGNLLGAGLLTNSIFPSFFPSVSNRLFG